jgi:succinate-semialdehyde dehydrogenase/glutarate-semialdehyde dehydrogenase
MRMLIDGQLTEADSGMTFDVIDPATGVLVDKAPLGGREDVRKAADAAFKAFDEWSGMIPRDRGKLLFKAGQAIRQKSDQLARLLTMEQGKPLKEARDEILGTANVFEYYSSISGSLTGSYVPMAPERFGIVLKRPIGVCGAIIPWNVPAILMSWKVAPALVTGNTLVLKPSSNAPLTVLSIASIMNEAGIPEGVLNVVTGSGDVVGDEVVTCEKIKKVSFTGASDTGKDIIRKTSKLLKRVTLELGGSDPMIVCDDIDIKFAVDGAIRGRFYNCGQTCTAIKRVYVFESIADEFIKMLKIKISGLKVGNGLDSGIDMGPLNNKGQLDKIVSQMEKVRNNDEGKIVEGGDILKGPKYDKGYFYAPTLVTDVALDSILLKEEVFGPVMPVVIVKDIDEAIDKANDSFYGLGSSIWTKNMERVTYASKRIEAGILWVNQHTKAPADMPFGGIKGSGIGRENGLDSLSEYLEIKSVMINPV